MIFFPQYFSLIMGWIFYYLFQQKNWEDNSISPVARHEEIRFLLLMVLEISPGFITLLSAMPHLLLPLQYLSGGRGKPLRFPIPWWRPWDGGGSVRQFWSLRHGGPQAGAELLPVQMSLTLGGQRQANALWGGQGQPVIEIWAAGEECKQPTWPTHHPRTTPQGVAVLLGSGPHPRLLLSPWVLKTCQALEGTGTNDGPWA